MFYPKFIHFISLLYVTGWKVFCIRTIWTEYYLSVFVVFRQWRIIKFSVCLGFFYWVWGTSFVELCWNSKVLCEIRVFCVTLNYNLKYNTFHYWSGDISFRKENWRLYRHETLMERQSIIFQNLLLPWYMGSHLLFRYKQKNRYST